MASIYDADAEEKALQSLLDAFPSAPVELIASAFTQANSDPDLAAEIIAFSLNGISSRLPPEHADSQRVSPAAADKGASASKRCHTSSTLPPGRSLLRPKGPFPPILEEFFPSSPEKNAWIAPLTNQLRRNVSVQDHQDPSQEPDIQPEHTLDDFPSLEARTSKEKNESQRALKLLPAPSRPRSNMKSSSQASAAFGLASSARTRNCKEVSTKSRVEGEAGSTYRSKQLETKEEEQSLWPSETETALLLMLGEQFTLDIDAVRDVLGHCEGDIEKAFEVLSQLNHIPSTSDHALRSASMLQTIEEKSISVSKGAGVQNDFPISEEQTDPPHLAKVILESLFSKPQEINVESQENHKHAHAKRKGQKAVEPAELPEWKALTSTELDISKDEEGIGHAEALNAIHEENKGEMSSYGEWESYERHHASAKEHWKTMQLYLKAATAAYAESNFSKAELLTEKADEFKTLSMEAKERANSFLLEKKNQQNESDFTLDLQEQHVTEALQLLRLHLKSFSSIPSCHMFTVITGCPEDKKSGHLKLKHEVVGYLRRKGYTWVETNPFCLQIHLKKKPSALIDDRERMQ